MPKLNIVLVEPRIHANAGNIARHLRGEQGHGCIW